MDSLSADTPLVQGKFQVTLPVGTMVMINILVGTGDAAALINYTLNIGQRCCS